MPFGRPVVPERIEHVAARALVGDGCSGSVSVSASHESVAVAHSPIMNGAIWGRRCGRSSTIAPTVAVVTSSRAPLSCKI